MVQFDNQYRQIKIKIVYYGPALGGKTSCLQHIHRTTDPKRRTKLYSMNTASDRTLFFDLLSLNLGRIRSYQLAIQLYTVPGQVQYDATRRAVLAGADGIVFVADSQSHCAEANTESLSNLWVNLAANGLDRAATPLVLHYNKRDLEPLLSIQELDIALNTKNVPAFPSVATSGDGVMEGFAKISELTLAAVADKLGVGSNMAAVERLQQQVRAALEPYLGGDGGAGPENSVSVTVPDGADHAEGPLDKDLLVGEAVKANMAMTDLNTQLDTLRGQLERKVAVLGGIQEYTNTVSAERDPVNILELLMTTAARLLDASAAAVMMVPGSGAMQEVAVHRLDHDPLLTTPDEVGEPFAIQLVAERQALLLTRDADEPSEGLLMATVEGAGFASALVVPLFAGDTIQGLLTVYGDGDRGSFGEEDLQLASVLGSSAAIGCSNARSWQQLESLNRGLEAQVEERTREVRSSLADVRRLAADLEEKNRVIDDAYRELSEVDRIKDELISRLATELKTPISSVGTAASILENYTSSLPEKGARFVTIIKDEAAKLGELIQSIFQASVLASAQKNLDKTPVPLGDLFKKGIMPLRDLAQQRNVRMKVLIPSGLESLECDHTSLEIALRAVFKNAIIFNKEGGEVKIAVRRLVRGGAPWLSVTVTDTGIGIPEEDLPYVFETFWQGDNAPANRPHGVGLGLSIAKAVVEKHGGEITVTSSHEGTEVVLALPQGG